MKRYFYHTLRSHVSIQPRTHTSLPVIGTAVHAPGQPDDARKHARAKKVVAVEPVPAVIAAHRAPVGPFGHTPRREAPGRRLLGILFLEMMSNRIEGGTDSHQEPHSRSAAGRSLVTGITEPAPERWIFRSGLKRKPG
ncbi:MAG: hypothetical protein HXY20_12435 [Acidobacteria bacterium]|nr:hypothetical protein [Acidobacteriota bacterium]